MFKTIYEDLQNDIGDMKTTNLKNEHLRVIVKF